MAKAGNRIIFSLECQTCKRRNYSTTKNKRTTPEKVKLKKYLLLLPPPHRAQGDQVVTCAGPSGAPTRHVFMIEWRTVSPRPSSGR